MAITGLTLPIMAPIVPPRPDVDEAVSVTVKMFRWLGVISDVQSLKRSLERDYRRLAELGDGRLYVELPAAVTSVSLVALANELAGMGGYRAVQGWERFRAPGAEDTLNSSASSYTARLALFAEDSKYDPILWFTDVSERITNLERIMPTRNRFAAAHAGASLRLCDHRDFLVWYIMDLLRGVPVDRIVLDRGWMHVPPFVGGCVCTTKFSAVFGTATKGGVGLSVGLLED